MGIQQALLNSGFVPQGTEPKTIVDNGKPGFQDTSRLGNMVRELKKVEFRREQDEIKRQDKLRNQASTYRTLRQSGYSSQRAYEAVQNNDLPVPSDEDNGLSEKEQADINLTNARTDNVQSQIKNREKPMGRKKADIEAGIIKKITENGLDSLLPGEKTYYKDVMKRSTATASYLDFLEGGTGAPSAKIQTSITTSNNGGTVKVISPDGRPGSYPKARWEKNKSRLMRQGYRLR